MNSIAGPAHWIGFTAFILAMLALDLGVLHRKSHEVKPREALTWTFVWVALSLGFNAGIYHFSGKEPALEFLTSYIIEKALSVDNVFVFILLLGSFAVPRALQHRVLFWGVLGAIVLRGIFIGLGAALLQRFHWVIYPLGAFLVFTGVRLLFAGAEERAPHENAAFRLFRKIVPAVSEFHGKHFTIVEDGRRKATPLLLVLVAIELTDVVFAVDSIPAIFAVTDDPFIVYTSNIFALLGLRALYFVLASVLTKLRFLKAGLALILAFVGSKMLLGAFVHIPIGISLGVIASLLTASVVASRLFPSERGGVPCVPPDCSAPRNGPVRKPCVAAAARTAQVASIMTNTSANRAATPVRSESGLRAVDSVYQSPGLHWVGDGFRVAGYFNRIPDAARRLSPFLLLDYHPVYDYPPSARPRGVGVHPHRGFETVTLAFSGSVAHHDSSGGGGVIGPGDVQWMTAASGILHKEYHEEAYSRRGGPFHMAQLWVNLPRANKLSPPRYQSITTGQIGVAELPGGAGTVRVIAGEYGGVRGPAKTFTPIHLLDASLRASGKLALSLPASYNVAVLVMQGDVTVNGATRAAKDDFILFANEGTRIDLEARSDARLLVLGGEPIDEPVVQYGPFVMNSAEEIANAITDFNRGKFGTLED